MRTAGEKVERKRLLDLLGADGHDDGVPGVVAPGAPRADVEVRGEDVDELALALVAPLRSEHDGDCPARTETSTKDEDRIGREETESGSG